MGQHFAASGEHLAGDRCWDVAAGQLQGRLQHRQGKALDAVAIELKVLALHRRQPLQQMVLIGPRLQQIGKPRLSQPKHRLIVPKRIVSIDADCGDGHGEAFYLLPPL